MSLSSPLLNLVFFVNMSAYHLRKTEVVYELKIRNLSIDGTAGDLRKRLSQGLASNVEIDETVVDSLVPGSELEECEGKLQDLSALVVDYEGNFSDNEYSRLMARLWHLYNRVSRIPVGAAASDVEEGKSGLLMKSNELLDAFEAAKEAYVKSSQKENVNFELPHTRTSSSGLQPSTSQGLPRSQPSPAAGSGERGHLEAHEHRRRDEEQKLKEEERRHEESWHRAEERLREERRQHEEMWKRKDNLMQEELKRLMERRLEIDSSSSTVFHRENAESSRQDQKSFQPRYVPVYKWGLQFDGQSQSVGAFLQRVEEIRRARGVTPEELYDSAVDLFSGPALVWYRSTMGRINTWGSLCLEMKIVFQSPDHDIRLQQEIFSRVQGEAEPIDLFIAAMEGLYGRLATVVPEAVRLRQIFHNLSPQLQDRLALFDVISIEQLRQLGRKAEAGRFRSTVPRGSTRSVGALEPDLAYEPSRRRTHQLASVQTPTKKEIRAICWNCGETGHRHNTCKQEKKRFCYGCGAPDIIKSNCTKCTKKCTSCANCSKNS